MSNALTTSLGIQAPIFLGPFGGMSSVQLTAAVSVLGGLGSFGLYGYSADRIRETTAALHAATDKPFGFNLWLPHEEQNPDGPNASFADARAALAPFFEELGLDLPNEPASYLPSFDEQFAAVLEAKPAVLSFVFGVPDSATIDAARSAGIQVVGAATTVHEAIALDAAGVDSIVATGSESAGHRVSFLKRPEDSLVGGMALIPQVVDAVSVPVIAAGAIADRRGVAAAFALGASGVQVGTAFLRTAESAASAAHKEAIGSLASRDTVLTRAMSGRLARGIRNRAISEIEERGTIAPFPMQNWLTGQFRPEAGKQNRGDLQSLWMGQAAALAHLDTAAEVFAELARGLPA